MSIRDLHAPFTRDSNRSPRFEDERKSLGLEKAKLIKENQVKKARLEELEKQLTEFVEVSNPVHA